MKINLICKDDVNWKYSFSHVVRSLIEGAHLFPKFEVSLDIEPILILNPSSTSNSPTIVTFSNKEEHTQKISIVTEDLQAIGYLVAILENLGFIFENTQEKFKEKLLWQE